MGTITTDLKEAFRRGNIYIQLIYINVAVFVVTTLTEVILQLFNRSLGGYLNGWNFLLHLPNSSYSPGHCSHTCLCMQVFCIFCSTCYGYIGLAHCS